MSGLDELRDRYEIVRATEDDKDKIIEACNSISRSKLLFTNETTRYKELFSHVESLREALQHEKNESEDQKKLVRVYREDLKVMKHDLQDKNQKEVLVYFILLDFSMGTSLILTIHT